MRRFRWWLSDLLRSWAEAVEPKVEGDFSESVLQHIANNREQIIADMEKNNALFQRLMKASEV